MHIHLPKPLHGWREVAGEVGIIVIGILIALGAEQAVEAIHHRSQVHEMTAKLHDESLENQGAMAFSEAGLQTSMARVDHDLAILGNCKTFFDASTLGSVEKEPFLLPVNNAWLGVRDSALLPLMPAQVVDDYWKIDTIESFMTPMLDDVDRSVNDALAAIDTLRGGIADSQLCAQTVYQLHRLKNSEQKLYRQAVFYRVSDKQVLDGKGLGLTSTKAGIRSSGLGGR
jgi:hypothetical protein